MMAATAAYVSTNVDGYALLLVFFGNARYRAMEVVAGQFVSVGVQIALSLATAKLGWRYDAPFVGLAGIVPLVVGLKRIAGLRRAGDACVREPGHRTFFGKGRSAHITTVSLVATSGAVDNVLVYSSLFAGRAPRDVAWAATDFVVLTAALCACAFFTARSPTSIRALRMAAARIAPFMTTAVGLSLLIRFKTLAWIYTLA
jgi:cadmium resistance protein CadD (predicted permease)